MAEKWRRSGGEVAEKWRRSGGDVAGYINSEQIGEGLKTFRHFFKLKKQHFIVAIVDCTHVHHVVQTIRTYFLLLLMTAPKLWCQLQLPLRTW